MNGWNNRHRPRASLRRGITLIEVLAALVIIGGSLTSILVAQSNSLEALKASQLELTAHHLAKELITNWKLDKEDLQVSASGTIADRKDWHWRRSTRKVGLAGSIDATEVRLVMLYDRDQTADRPWQREYLWLIKDKKEP